jgi:hypothetical protein
MIEGDDGKPRTDGLGHGDAVGTRPGQTTAPVEKVEYSRGHRTRNSVKEQRS